jgi:hypothetical protein
MRDRDGRPDDDLWTPVERAERRRIIFALADALMLTTIQINYARVAQLLEMSRATLIDKMFHYGIPTPALAKELTPAERERIPRLERADVERYDDFALEVATFIREVWPSRR